MTSVKYILKPRSESVRTQEQTIYRTVFRPKKTVHVWN